MDHDELSEIFQECPLVSGTQLAQAAELPRGRVLAACAELEAPMVGRSFALDEPLAREVVALVEENLDAEAGDDVDDDSEDDEGEDL